MLGVNSNIELRNSGTSERRGRDGPGRLDFGTLGKTKRKPNTISRKHQNRNQNQANVRTQKASTVLYCTVQVHTITSGYQSCDCAINNPFVVSFSSFFFFFMNIFCFHFPSSPFPENFFFQKESDIRSDPGNPFIHSPPQTQTHKKLNAHH